MVYHLNVLVCASYNFASCKIHVNINHKQNDPKIKINKIIFKIKIVY